ncbi:MAG: glycosyltransferase family 39 protein [Patescibacteria group bacterium]|nr:glycosyltransferase family 39 protein [Patescibacteria group bacterium]MCL5431557.1 glycosyltransferase family 39 protein [Patescibacteria group bacterium]
MKKFLLPATFILIIVLAFFLRFYHLTLDPPHLYWDEASIAYNAYSINQTEKDEWGAAAPVLFKAFGEYKFPAYIYLTAASQRLFGLTDFAVRFPSAIAGVLIVVVVFFLTKELFGNLITALLSSFFVAVSPWALQFSRAGFEANLAVLLIVSGIYFFLRKAYLISLMLIAAALYTYQAAFVSVPLVLLLLIISFSHTKRLILPLIVFAVVLLPLANAYLFSGGRARAASENFLNMAGNPVTNLTNNYVANFSLDYLFFHGDQDGRHSVKKIGELYLWQLPLILAGCYVLLRRPSKAGALVFGLILAGSLPPALTTVSPHALRGLLAMVGWQLLSASGAVWLLAKTPKFWRLLAIAVIGYALIIYLNLYWVNYPAAYAADWQDGQRQTVEYLKRVEGNYSEILVSQDLNPIYIFLYWPVDPRVVQDSGHNEQTFLKFHYVDLGGGFDPVKQYAGRKVLVVTPGWYNNESWTILRAIKSASGDYVFRIYEF